MVTLTTLHRLLYIVLPPEVDARRLSDRFVSQKFSKNQNNFFTAIFIYGIDCRIVGEVVLLKSKRDGFWTNGQFAPISLIIPGLDQAYKR